MNARDEKQEPIFLGLETASYGRAFATYTSEKEPQAKNFISNLPVKLEVFDNNSLRLAMKTDEDGCKIPIGISAGPTSKTITAYETYLLENLPTMDCTDKPTAPPTNVKRIRRYYDVPVEQHDGSNDGISYKKVLQRHSQAKNQHQAPAQNQAQNNLTEPQLAKDQVPKPPNLPPPESETMRKLRAQIRDTQTENEKAVEHVKTLEAETVKISGLFAGLSSRLTGLENSVTNCVSQSVITAKAITNMNASMEQDRVQRQQELKAFELKMLTLLSTFNPAQVYPLPNYPQHPNIPPFPQQNPVSPSLQARANQDVNPRSQEEIQNAYLREGGFQIIKRGRHSPEPGQETNTPAKYQCTDDDEQLSPTKLPLTQEEDQEHHLLGDAQI